MSKNFKFRKIFAGLLILSNNMLCDIRSSWATVDHKTPLLNAYLDQISENQEEKAGILDIIRSQKSGSFLDIGSGRDTISYIINNLPTDDISSVNLIAADIEGKTLAEIAKKYPEFYLNLDRKSNIDLSLVKMDATEMHQIKESSIKAINASALVHEINSYVPSKTPIDRFFGEAIRILEKDGFLVYRDPTLQSDPESINMLDIKNDFAKKFAVLFLPKFLDNKLTLIKDMHGKSIKPEFHYQDRLTVTLSLVGSNKPITLDYDNFLSMQTSSIDFKKDISIKAPRRLLSEIQRHYILFIKNVYPLGFVDGQAINPGKIIASYTPKMAKQVVSSFTKSLKVNYEQKLKTSDVKLLTAESSRIDELMHKGCKIKLNAAELAFFENLIKEHNISGNLYKIEADNIWLDAKLLTILYNRFNQQLDRHNLPVETMQWLVREGEEFYFYFTTQQLLDYLHKFCQFYLKGTSKEGCVLAPVSDQHIKYASRELYNELLDRDMLQLNSEQEKQEFVTTKTIITFQLMSPKLVEQKLKNQKVKYSMGANEVK